jgi:plastocyanin
MFSRLRTRTRSGAAPAALPSLETLEDRLVPTLLGNSLFPADNPWNQQITNAPVAANSTAIINNIIGQQGSDGRLHPDFGQDYNTSSDLYGIPYNVVHGNSTPKVHVAIDAYASESDLQNAPIPANAVLEGDFQNGPNVGVNNRGDSHLIVYDVDNNIAYEFYRASRPSENSDGQWHADQETVWNMNTDEFRTLGDTSADAAGLAILPGLVRPDEGLPVSQGGQGVINHAIRFTLQNSIILDQFIYPASHIANSGSNATIQPPMGARFRLKASVDISQLDPESRVIAQAMKDYGLILADNGSNFFFSGASYSVNASNAETLTWNDNDIQDSLHGLKSLTFSDFEVVSLTPVVTGLSASGGSAGQAVTITGQNFSGAAGHLQVLFGNTPASNVTVVDDGHVTATVPAGSGTVDVRVQSGVADPNDSENINSPVFGYGTSAVSSADRFSYGGSSGNAPPTVATPAAASPSTVKGKTTALSVLGADDGGEANLTYTWAMTVGPTGAHPTFSANGTNAAKNSTVTFDHAGSYTFQVTITDAGGLSAPSSVNVTVVQTLTSIKLSPSSATVAPGGTVQFSATALDQFAAALAQQPTFTWSIVSGPGKVNSTGLYTAPSTKTGTATVQVSAGTVHTRATITVKRSGTSSQKSLVNPLL